MKQDNKNKKIIGISLGVVGALLLIFSGTYAYWQLTKEQSSANEIVAACLDFELSDVTEAISLERAYPISEEESESLTGYTFKVINNCNDSIDYMIGLNSITNNSENYLANTSLRVKLDDKQSKIYETLNDIEYIENVRYSKELGTSTILGNSENTHLLKVWVDENAPVTEQGKTFTGKIIITGSVGNTSSGEQIADSCFTIASDGTLLGYDYSCGTDIVVPAEVNGIRVKKIVRGAFAGEFFVNLGMSGFDGDKDYETEEVIALLKNSSSKDEILTKVKNTYCSTPSTCTIEELETSLDELFGQKTVILTSEEEYNAYDFSQYDEIESFGINLDDTSNSMPPMLATTLDLSNAIYLEEIGENAFYLDNEYYTDELTEDNCEINHSSSSGTYVCQKPYGLTGVTFPQNGVLTTIGGSAFYENKLNGTLRIPASVKYIEAERVFGGNNITNIVFEDTLEHPSQLERIGCGALAGFTENQITFPNKPFERYNDSNPNNSIYYCK